MCLTYPGSSFHLAVSAKGTQRTEVAMVAISPIFAATLLLHIFADLRAIVRVADGAEAHHAFRNPPLLPTLRVYFFCIVVITCYCVPAHLAAWYWLVSGVGWQCRRELRGQCDRGLILLGDGDTGHGQHMGVPHGEPVLPHSSRRWGRSSGQGR